MSGSEPTPLARVPTGIVGLDEMLQGGIPAGHLVLVTGLPGTGKTTLALQFLFAGIARGERGIFLSLDEDAESLMASARGFGLPIDAAMTDGRFEVLRLDPQETKQNIHRLQGEFVADLRRRGAQRLVVDSVSLLHMLSEDETGRRTTLFALASACREAGLTAIFTAEADPLHPEVSRDGLSEYIADGVLVLGYTRDNDGRRISLALRILKMRRTAHTRTVQPYAITARGIEVNAKAVDFGSG
jgi:circadian clock protein KaiC